MNRRHTITIAVGLCLSIAAVAAPTATADPRSVADLSPQLRAVLQADEGAAITPDDRPFQRVVVSSSEVVSPDDRAFSRGVSPSENAQSSSPDDRSFFRGIETLPVPAAPSVPTSRGFQWDDATIGAATTLSLMALLGMAALALRRQGRRLTTL